jgi:hypothetical protein
MYEMYEMCEMYDAYFPRRFWFRCQEPGPATHLLHVLVQVDGAVTCGGLLQAGCAWAYEYEI